MNEGRSFGPSGSTSRERTLGSPHAGRTRDSQGTVDEKIPYALDDLRALPMAGCIAYAGTGFSEGVRYMLEASPHAAYCMPLPVHAAPTNDTRELDHLLATYFGWWDVLVGNRKPV